MIPSTGVIFTRNNLSRQAKYSARKMAYERVVRKAIQRDLIKAAKDYWAVDFPIVTVTSDVSESGAVEGSATSNDFFNSASNFVR